MKKNTMYITYDGLLDPLGKAQIIPYIISISQHPRNLTIISFEKKENFKEIHLTKEILHKHNIDWFYLKFSSKFRIFSKIIDVIKLFYFTIFLKIKNNIKIVHGRGSLPSFYGYLLKKIFNIKLVFDCRGMWVDERIDNNQWNLNKWYYNLISKIFRKIENQLFTNSDKIIVLSRKILPYLLSRYDIENKISVIPCCVDYDLFKKKHYDNRSLALVNKFNIGKYDFIFCYSGSLGGIYQLEEMLTFFEYIKKHYQNSFFIFFTNNIKILEKKISEKKYEKIKDNIRYKVVDREQLPTYLSLCDAMVYFIKPTFSKRASCPTKLGESLSLGIPIITNKGIGDIEDLFELIKPGFLFNEINSENFQYFIDNIDLINQIKGNTLRENYRVFFDIKKAKISYESLYLKLE